MASTTISVSPPSGDVLLCISASFGRGDLISSIIPRDLFPARHISDANPREELKEAKLSGRPIVLLVLGPSGHDGIKYLCDDFDKPVEDRRVKWIHSASAGVDWYRLDDLQDEVRGVPFTNGKGGYSYFLALHVVYSILYFNRQTARLLQNKQERRWDMFDMEEPRGQNVGIVGYGDIGRATAKMLMPLLVNVTGVKRNVSEEEVRHPIDEFGVRVVCGDEALDKVIAESDYIVNILPATADTKGVFNKDVFVKMKSSAVYINVGRGATQNEEDLCDALHKGIIGGASLDVFEIEPTPPNSPLFDVGDDKLLMTSHNACITKTSFRETIGLFATSARGYLEKGEISGYHPNVMKGY